MSANHGALALAVTFLEAEVERLTGVLDCERAAHGACLRERDTARAVIEEIRLSPEESLVLAAAHEFGRAAAAYANTDAYSGDETAAQKALFPLRDALHLAARRIVTPGVTSVYQRSSTVLASKECVCPGRRGNPGNIATAPECPTHGATASPGGMLAATSAVPPPELTQPLLPEDEEDDPWKPRQPGGRSLPENHPDNEDYEP